MIRNFLPFVGFTLAGLSSATGSLVDSRNFPFAPAVGAVGSDALSMESGLFIDWASSVVDIQYGEQVDEVWHTPEKALGEAVGESSHVVSLGRGGQITLSFTHPIVDGDGADFAVFENGLNDGFLELAWVEVSSDGENFVRFPNVSMTANPVESYAAVNPAFLHGLASKYRQGWGTPFDLQQLRLAYDAWKNGTTLFSTEYGQSLENNFPLLDMANVRFVRLIDIVGDGTALDAEGAVIFDPFPTIGSAGFDLDAIGVLNNSVARPSSELLNLSTRGMVTPSVAMIGGLVIEGEGGESFLIRGIGPSLADFGVASTLEDPTLTLLDADGQILEQNDDWFLADNQASIAETLPPSRSSEPAILITLPPGAYTVLLQGKDQQQGEALMEIYKINRD